MSPQLLPVQVKFFDYFQAASANVLEAATLLQTLLDNYHNVDGILEQITELEHKGDMVVHEVANLLPRTLITPFDSDDIKRLIDALDNTLDSVHAAATGLSIYQIAEIKEPAKRMAHLTVEGASELQLAIKGLQDKKMYTDVKKHVVQLNTIENAGDRVFEEALRDLVKHHVDVFDFICWKEIYELLEQSTDRLEDAGDIIENVMIANA
jgi:uncharacterized protein